MKNVFIINSHTTFLSAMGTINYLKLPSENVLMLYMRNYNNRCICHDYKVLEVSDFMNSFDTLFSSHAEQKKCIERIDDFIECNIGEKYRLFCPHLGHGVWQAFYTHSLCMEMSYIQEGGMPYTTVYLTHFSFKRFILFYSVKIYLRTNRVWRGGWYTHGTMTKQKELHSYAVNSLFFRKLPSINHIIKWPTVDVGIKIKLESTIFIFDGFVQNHLIERDFYMKKCRELVFQCVNNYNYIKFHPAQTQEDIEMILSYFQEQKCRYELLPNDIPFEMILLSNRNLKLAGFGSSLLYFAYELGNEVISQDQWLLSSPLYKNYRKKCGFMSFTEYKKSLVSH